MTAEITNQLAAAKLRYAGTVDNKHITHVVIAMHHKPQEQIGRMDSKHLLKTLDHKQR